MQINNIPEAFKTKLRIMILSALATGKKTFREVKDITGATDGNLSVQLSQLEEMKYLTIDKCFISKKPQTTYELTDVGYNNFCEYVDMLNQVLKETE